MTSLVTRFFFFNLHPFFPENSLALGLQQQLSFLGIEGVKLKFTLTGHIDILCTVATVKSMPF